jgi:site-specific recombinase XerD
MECTISSAVQFSQRLHSDSKTAPAGGGFAHVLRHSLATQMVVRGGTFKEIADVLGHQSLVTTEIYAKLDLGSLSQVAMPWPGGNQ